MKYLKNINEFNLSLENYNNYYYLVLRFNEDTIKSLINGEFIELKGISDSINIIKYFFDIRDILLVMEKNKVEELNNIEKIKYTDLEYLTNDNFKVLKRLYQVDDKYSLGSILYQGFRRTEYFKNKKDILSNKNKLRKLYNTIETKLYNKFKKVDSKIHLIEDKYYKNYNDLLNNYFEIIKNLVDDLTIEELDIILQYVILTFASLFEKEGEVSIKNNIFKIPENSYLFIKESHPTSNSNITFNEIKNKYFLKLKEKYYVKILPYIKGDIISNTHKSVFSYIRYLNQLIK